MLEAWVLSEEDGRRGLGWDQKEPGKGAGWLSTYLGTSGPCLR
jgi:hypothetical protein